MKKSIRTSDLKLKSINVKQTKLEERTAPRVASDIAPSRVPLDKILSRK